MAAALAGLIFSLVAMTTVTMTSSSRILLIPAPHYSHINFFTIAAKELKDNGHDVSLLVFDQHLKRVSKANVSSIAYPLSPEATVIKAVGDIFTKLTESDDNVFSKGYYAYNAFTTVVDRYCREVLGSKDMMGRIKDGKFDLAIVDSFPIMGCLQYIPYKFDIPMIHLGPFIFPWMHGVSSVPFHEPPLMLELRKPELTFSDRMMSVFMASMFENVLTFVNFDQYGHEYLPERPFKTVKQLMIDSEMTLVTIEIHCFDFPRISAPHYRFIGSLSGSVSVQPLPQEFKKFADEAKDGLIVISFGSVIDLRKTIVKPIAMLIEALGRMKERAILQFSLDDLEGVTIPPNVLVNEWLPQTDLLAHPNTKLFIAHGGLNGHLEATYFGVPILTLPYQPEQARNGARAEAKGHGKLLKWEETDQIEIYETIRELIDNQKYAKSIQKCAEILKEIPSARTELVFWVNHVLKHGSDHLRPLAADMPFYQFFGLDLLSVFLTAFVLVCIISYACLKCCCRMCCKSSPKLKRE